MTSGLTLRTRINAAAIVASVFSCYFASAQSARVIYERLTSETTYEQGCHDPCACPIFTFQPVIGTFRLIPAGVDPLFQRYTVAGVDWTLPGRRITGSGSYRIGGEVALMQQLTLDLSTNGGPVTRFDSGLVGVSVQFPRLNVSINDRVGDACFYADIMVNAVPFCPADVDDGTRAGTPDGGVGIEDLLYYLLVYSAGTAGADLDDGSGTGQTDGGVGIEDLLFYLARYNAGC